jgi:hypothetical protein
MHYYTHEELDGATRASLNGFARTIKLRGRSKLKVNELRDALRERLPPREGTSPGLFVELCAGTAALSLRLHKEQAKPPVSRMGSKTGYANTILHELGLYPGLKADHYLWCEPDDGCRLLLETYRDHDLATATAEIILGWKDEDPKSLWTRLRKEGPVVAPTPREAARWCVSEAWTNSKQYMGPDRPSKCHPPGWVASITLDGLNGRVSTLPALPGEITDGAVDPREAARWVQIESMSQIGGGFDIAGNYGYQGNGYQWKAAPKGWQAERLLSTPTLPGEITDGAVEPPLLPENTVVYIDPPYVGTTGYKHTLGRDRVVELALAWHAAGATVCISEQEAIPELVAQGWRSVNITGKRQGQKRTFSKQKSEYLTISKSRK